jgi:hypothetical protein
MSIKNTEKKMNKIVAILLMFWFGIETVSAQNQALIQLGSLAQKDKWMDIHVRKSGPYFGVQRGLFWVGEVGGEMQFKKVKLVKPVTQAIHTGVNYNFTNNVLGYDAGYWIKFGRFNFTYGGNVIMRTDFKQTSVGFAPMVGFKLTQFHIQTGYNFLTPSSTVKLTNTFFIALRFVLINKRDWDVDTKKSKDKKGLFQKK